MKLGVVTGIRYCRVGDQYYTKSQFNAQMWGECLEVFDEVLLANRIVYRDKISPGEKAVLAKGISFFEFPNFKGFFGVFLFLPIVLFRAKQAVRQAELWHIHTPNIISICMWFWLWFYRIPYSVELRGDQSINPDYLRLRGVKFAGLIAKFMRFTIWMHMSNPIAASSVAQFLFDLTKPRRDCPMYVVSNARIPHELFREKRCWAKEFTHRTIVSLGRLEAQKNPIGTLNALAKLDKMGFRNWEFIWIGDGPLKVKVEDLAKKLQISDRIKLLDFVPWEGVFSILDGADLYLLNSVAEGLPRATLEAMSCALPVIGTRAGAWSEILSEDDSISPLCDDLLADKLYQVLTDSERLTEMSKRNREMAEKYSAESLRARKIEFYRTIRRKVEKIGRAIV